MNIHGHEVLLVDFHCDGKNGLSPTLLEMVASAPTILCRPGKLSSTPGKKRRVGADFTDFAGATA
jgi:hypothetical protein